MPITRAKAERLLNKTEMGLYDDSRINALRQLDASGLARRVQRARTARDRARDLVKRQKLASRERTGSKRGRSGNDNQRSKDKVEVLADILGRFEAALKQARRRGDGSASTSGRAASKTIRGSAAGKAAKQRTGSSPRRAADRPVKPAARKTTEQTVRRRTRTASKAAPAQGEGTMPARPRRARTGKRAITPQQALDNTRTLLEAKQAQAREPKSWQAPGGDSGNAPQPGYQSSAAARRAEELHAGESRLPAIQGSIGTRDRLNQGKRDHRRSGED